MFFLNPSIRDDWEKSFGLKKNIVNKNKIQNKIYYTIWPVSKSSRNWGKIGLVNGERLSNVYESSENENSE
jgi:hypothetical protein